MSISTTDTNKPATHSQTPEKPTTTVPHVVIIGGGFGGLQAAKDLGKQPVKVTVIDKNNFHLFQPMLYSAGSQRQFISCAGSTPAHAFISCLTYAQSSSEAATDGSGDHHRCS